MNFFRSAPTQDYTKKVEIIGERDDVSSYSYGDEFSECENPSKKAAEMENILGNALAMTERSTGSLHSLTRSGTIDLGRRIATMNSREEMGGISDAHLTNNDSFNYISRTSSLGSVVSLPTFVKVERGDQVIFSQQSWDNYMMSDDYNEEKDEEQQNYNVSKTEAQETPKPHRSWNKLRREVNEESRAKYEEEENIGIGRRSTQSIGKKVIGLRKKIDALVENVRSERSDKNTRNSKGCAKDYDVEVSLHDRKFFWDRQPSIIKGKGKTSKSKRRSRNRNNEKENRGGNNSRNTNTDAEDSSLVEETIVERNSNVVIKSQEIMHEGDVLFQALEVACCHSIDGETLDLITDMVPPQM
jgi:hypothetical protein